MVRGKVPSLGEEAYLMAFKATLSVERRVRRDWNTS